MDRIQKREFVASMHGMFVDAGVVVVAGYAGLSVAQITLLRSRMRDVGGHLKVVKNRLARIALEGTDAAVISDLLKGPVLVACSRDPLSAPKIAVSFSKESDSFVVLGGVVGNTLLDRAGVVALAELPSMDELRGKIIGVIQTPAARMASVLQAPAGQLARVLGAYARQGNAA